MNAQPAKTPQRRAPRDILVNIVIRVMRPLARLMLQHGITLYEFIEIARWVFANVAMGDKRFSVRNRDAWSMTKSRAAVLTGMTRRQIDRQVKLPEPATATAREAWHRGVRVLAAWATEPDYHDAHGRRGDLPLRGEHGSFEQLVRIYCRDTSVRSMLDELLFRGCIAKVAPNTIRFVHDDVGAMPPFRCDIQQLEQAAEDFLRLLERQLHNQPSGALLHVVSPALSREEREYVQARLQLHMEKFMRDVRQEFLAGTRPLHDAHAEHFIAGVYYDVR